MKKVLLALIFLPSLINAQTNRVSTSNGNFLNPLIWNPIGIPASGDSLIINHDVIMNTGIYYTAGQIKIGPAGSLIEDAIDRAFWADGTGSVINQGTITAHLLLISPSASFTNGGYAIGIDSLWNQGTIQNSGRIEVYDYLNDETSTVSNNYQIEVTHDMNNQGEVNNNNLMTVGNDFSNCNIQTMDAMFNNDGFFCVTNDFANCINDTINGSGEYYVGGSSTNLGVFDGSHTFYTPSGTLGITGNVQPGVTIAAGTCGLGIDEKGNNSTKVYPNPTTGLLHIASSGSEYELYDVMGRMKSSGEIVNGALDVSNLPNGVYLLKIGESELIRIIKE